MNWARSNIYMNKLDELTRIWKLYKLALDITIIVANNAQVNNCESSNADKREKAL